MSDKQVKPISLIKSIILFSIPGVVGFFGFYYIIPILNKIDIPLILTFPFFLWVGILPLLPLSIFLYKKENRKHSLEDFKQRFRLKKIKGKEWLWVIIGILFCLLYEPVIGELIGKWMAGYAKFLPMRDTLLLMLIID